MGSSAESHSGSGGPSWRTQEASTGEVGCSIQLSYTNPVTLPATATVAGAAKKMRDDDIGDVIVMDGGRVFGIVTDRDIVVRAMAEDRDPATTSIRDVCTIDLVTMSPDDDVKKAIDVTRERAIRRIPVCQQQQVVVQHRAARATTRWASSPSATSPSSRTARRHSPTSARRRRTASAGGAIAGGIQRALCQT